MKNDDIICQRIEMENKRSMYGYDIYHEKQLNTVIRSVQEGKPSHAYIFCGEKGLKRHECAELVSTALVCENHEQAPCGTCPECVKARAKTHPDISYIQPPKDKKSIGVDDIRALTDDCFIKPFSKGSKVYIIEGDAMTEQAQNALLKTLEEPPEYAVFIIISSDQGLLLDTVQSRCTTIFLPTLSSEAIKKIIRAEYPTENRIDFLADYSEGNPGKLKKIICDEGFEALRKSSLEHLSMLLSDRLYSAYRICDFFEKNKEQAEEILNLWLIYLRDIILVSEGFTDKVINSDLTDKLKILSHRTNEKKLAFAAERVTVMCKMLARFVNIRAAALNLALTVKKMQIF